MNNKTVTFDECAKNMAPIQEDLATVLKALVGDDLRGGIVKDVADTKKDISEIKNALKSKPPNCEPNKGNSWGRREKALVAVAVIGASASVVIATIEALV
jgi:hypothetical protein